MLVHSTFLTSAASTSEISNYILPLPLRRITMSCPFRAEALQDWSQGHGEEPPIGSGVSVQKACMGYSTYCIFQLPPSWC